MSKKRKMISTKQALLKGMSPYLAHADELVAPTGKELSIDDDSQAHNLSDKLNSVDSSDSSNYLSTEMFDVLIHRKKRLDTAQRLKERYGEQLMWKYEEYDGLFVFVPIYTKNKKRKVRLGIIRTFFPEELTEEEKCLLFRHAGIAL